MSKDIKNNSKVSFFENIFYWTWYYTPKGGLPDRSFSVIVLSQYANFMFCVSLVLTVLNNDTIIVLYKMDQRLTILPLAVVFIALYLVNMKIYDKKKYHTLKSQYDYISKEQIKKNKRTFFIYIIISIITAIAAVKLFTFYAEKVEQEVDVGSQLFTYLGRYY